MKTIELDAQQQAEAERIYQALRSSADDQIRQLAHLLASKPNGELLGPTEFTLRDIVHRLAAQAIETALAERKKGATSDPAHSALTASTTPASSGTLPKPS